MEACTKSTEQMTLHNYVTALPVSDFFFSVENRSSSSLETTRPFLPTFLPLLSNLPFEVA